MNPLVNIAIDAARQAGRIIIKASERLDLITITPKENFDIVTNVDHESEYKIIQTIRKAYPNHAILAEESGVSGEHDVTWIIDPLDGTTNYAHAFPHYCISIAIKVKQRLEHGVIYDPLRDELFVASVGTGAQLNGRKIRCKQHSTLDGAFLGVSHLCSNNDSPRSPSLKLQQLMNLTAGVRRTGSAALDLAYVAAGRLDGFFAEQLQWWDCAAGIVLLREAGGLVSDFSGSEADLEKGELVAANPKLFKQLLQFLQ